MLTFAENFGKNEFSQGGEDGIIAEATDRLGLATGRCVEFGAHDGKFCSNTRRLLTARGWKGLMIEGNQDLFAKCCSNMIGLDCEVKHEMVTPENVNELIGSCDLLSIDCDGPDYGIWKAYIGNPAIVIIEINSSIDPTADAPVNDINHGTAYKPMVELALDKGYFLLCHTGNLIFIDTKYRSLFPEIEGDPIVDYSLYFNAGWL